MNVDDRVAAEKVRLMYRQAAPAQIISVGIAALLASVVWNEIDRRLIVTWLGFLVLMGVMRLLLLAAFRRSDGKTALATWERYFVLSLIFSGLVWGVGGWLMMPAHSMLHQAVVYLFLVGLTGGAVASYAAHAPAALITIGGLMLPATVALALQDGVVPRAMAAAGVIYMAAAYRATRTLDFFLRRSFQLSSELDAARVTAEQLARTDELTGLRNRRAFAEYGELAMGQAARHGRPLALVLVDLDQFKAVNDRFGHAAGDRALAAVAAAIARTARATDISARLGGDEFAILLPDATGEDAVRQAERLRRALAAITVPALGDSAVTCSMGVAARGPAVPTLDALLKHADRALYDAKRRGRNRISPIPSADEAADRPH